MTEQISIHNLARGKLIPLPERTSNLKKAFIYNPVSETA